MFLTKFISDTCIRLQ